MASLTPTITALGFQSEQQQQQQQQCTRGLRALSISNTTPAAPIACAREHNP